MLDGWQREGLRPPERVLAATADYLETADAYGRWAEELVFHANATMTKAAAWGAWKAWAERNGEFMGGQRRLREYLLSRPKVDEARLGHVQARSWIGVGLKAG